MHKRLETHARNGRYEQERAKGQAVRENDTRNDAKDGC